MRAATHDTGPPDEDGVDEDGPRRGVHGQTVETLARNRVMVVTDVVDAVVQFAAAVLVLSGTAEIWHLAAVYDLSVARDLGMRVNIEGTRNVLRFADSCPSSFSVN